MPREQLIDLAYGLPDDRCFDRIATRVTTWPSVATEVLEDVLLLAGVVVADHSRAEEGLERVVLQPTGTDEISRRLSTDVIDEDLA